MNPSGKSKTSAKVTVFEQGKRRSHSDYLVTEEPLEIRLVNPDKTVAVTMRTPGADFELVAGFLFTEGLVNCRDEIDKMSYCVDPKVDGEQQQNIVNVTLKAGLTPNFQSLERHFLTTSACGVCGKANIESLKVRGCAVIESDLKITSDLILKLPENLRKSQALFHSTGGLHAAALFDEAGNLLKVREDVGRHNALDKLMGSAFLANELPLSRQILLVSGRSSFEILQKGLVGRIPIICSVSAPSSLAVAIAQTFNITLIGFLRETRFNVYSGLERIINS